jgi:hypothetical protein
VRKKISGCAFPGSSRREQETNGAAVTSSAAQQNPEWRESEKIFTYFSTFFSVSGLEPEPQRLL